MTNEQEIHLKTLIRNIKFPVYYDNFGQKIFDADNKLLIDIRGWGWIQNLNFGAQIQDAFGTKLTELINSLTPESSKG